MIGRFLRQPSRLPKHSLHRKNVRYYTNHRFIRRDGVDRYYGFRQVLPKAICSHVRRVKGVVFDLAGTLVDPGVKAPTRVFRDVFANAGVVISEEEARVPMGSDKRDHIKEIGEMNRVKAEWRRVHGREFALEDVEHLYSEFIPAQLEVIPQHSYLVPGALNTVRYSREFFDLVLGCTSGYNRDMINLVTQQMTDAGLELDVTVASNEVKRPRPYKDGCYANMDMMNIHDPSEMVKVGDTPIDVAEGKDARMWTVAILKYSNEVGLDPNEIEYLEKEDVSRLWQKYEKAADKLFKVEPDYLAFDINSLPFVIHDINMRLGHGDSPRVFLEKNKSKTKSEDIILPGDYQHKDLFLL